MGVILTHFAWIIYLSKGVRDCSGGPVRVAEQIGAPEQHQKREYTHETPMEHVSISCDQDRVQLEALRRSCNDHPIHRFLAEGDPKV